MALLLVLAALAWGAAPGSAQYYNAELPNPFSSDWGRIVTTPEEWRMVRPDLLGAMVYWQYGQAPPIPTSVIVQNRASTNVYFASHDLWVTKVTATLRFGPSNQLALPVAYWRPMNLPGPFPTVLAMEPVWWPDPFQTREIVQRVTSRGFALAGFDHNALASFEDPAIKPAKDAYAGLDWGVVAVGAWGYSVTMTWLEQEAAIDASKVAITGHSRRGKSCLLAGALDERFAAVAPHMSGMGGTAAYRVRGSGSQRLQQLLEQYWLHPRIFGFINNENAIPLDQHWLIAAVAPRLFYQHIGMTDNWGNPLGCQAAQLAAREVYEFLGVPGNIGHRFVASGHVDPQGPDGWESWDSLLQWLEMHWMGKAPAHDFQALPYSTSQRGFTWSRPLATQDLNWSFDCNEQGFTATHDGVSSWQAVPGGRLVFQPTPGAADPWVASPAIGLPLASFARAIIDLDSVSIPGTDAFAALYLFTEAGHAAWQFPIQGGLRRYRVNLASPPIDNGGGMAGSTLASIRLDLPANPGPAYNSSLFRVDQVTLTPHPYLAPEPQVDDCDPAFFTFDASEDGWSIANDATTSWEGRDGGKLRVDVPAGAADPFVNGPGIDRPMARSQYLVFSIEGVNVPAGGIAQAFLFTEAGHAGFSFAVREGRKVYVANTAVTPDDNGGGMSGATVTGLRIDLPGQAAGGSTTTYFLDWAAISSSPHATPAAQDLVSPMREAFIFR